MPNDMYLYVAYMKVYWVFVSSCGYLLFHTSYRAQDQAMRCWRSQSAYVYGFTFLGFSRSKLHTIALATRFMAV